MPLSPIQSRVLRLLASNRSPESHLAGATGVLLAARSPRVSHDLDLFHDTEEAVASAFAADRKILLAAGCAVELRLSQPGFVRATVAFNEERLLVDWARDSAWRFFPPVELEGLGWVLHPVDLAVNKVLALVGRDEPRDLIDVLYLDAEILPLGALAWAAAGKDAGLNPEMLLDFAARKGRLSESDLRRLEMRTPQDAREIGVRWAEALGRARAWIGTRPAEEAGCLYLNPATGRLVAPAPGETAIPIRGNLGGVIPVLQGVPYASLADSPEYRSQVETFFDHPARRLC